jgi:prepilin-type processing-associated H-X9-DG protein
MRRLVLLAGLVGTLAGCTDSTAPSDPVSGRWIGTATDITVDLTIARQGSDISGSGNFLFIDGSTAITVNGTWVPPNISLVLSSAGFQDTHLGGTLNAGIIDGLLNGSGFSNLEMVLSRE